jgi:hypothetical protein
MVWVVVLLLMMMMKGKTEDVRLASNFPLTMLVGINNNFELLVGWL